MAKAKAKNKNGEMGQPLEIDTSPAQERVEAELVEDGYEVPLREDAEEGLDVELLDEIRGQAEKLGLPGDSIVGDAPSTRMNPYVSEEEQGMEMRPAIVGPPPYGSPDAATSAGRLVELTTHPLRPDALPEDHPAAISRDYGQGQDATISGTQTITSQPGAPQVESDTANEEANATAGAMELADAEGVNLADVEGSGEEGRITKADVEDYLAESQDDTEQS